jgi:hypothetical protein
VAAIDKWRNYGEAQISESIGCRAAPPRRWRKIQRRV